MKTLINYLKYSKNRYNTPEAYYQMRSDYVNSKVDIINKVSYINKFVNPKYNISQSSGVLGILNKSQIEDIVKSIDKDGFYIFPKQLDVEKVGKLKQFALTTPLNYLEIQDKSVGYSKDLKLFEESRNISNRHQYLDISVFNNSPEILELIYDENFLHIANEYLGAKPILDIVTMWWSNVLHLENKELNTAFKSAAAQMFHFDMDRLKFLKFFVYLTDVTPETGPHVYVRNTHKKVPSYVTHDGRLGDDLIAQHDKQNTMEITGAAGTIIAVDTRGLHKGKELEKGERLIFQIEFTNSLFGNPDVQKVTKKLKFNAKPNYRSSYELFI